MLLVTFSKQIVTWNVTSYIAIASIKLLFKYIFGPVIVTVFSYILRANCNCLHLLSQKIKASMFKTSQFKLVRSYIFTNSKDFSLNIKGSKRLIIQHEDPN
jgi:hypothetical protein